MANKQMYVGMIPVWAQWLEPGKKIARLS